MKNTVMQNVVLAIS